LEGTERIGWGLIGEQSLDHFILREVSLFHQALDKRFGVVKRGNLKNIRGELKTVTCFGQKDAAIKQFAAGMNESISL
jgi:hypothetical protein